VCGTRGSNRGGYLAGSAGAAAGRPRPPARGRSGRRKEGRAGAWRRGRVGGGHREGGEFVNIVNMLIDLSRWSQSRDAQERPPAARSGLGPWVGAGVASSPCPLLRPGSSRGFGATACGQFRAGSAAGTTKQKTPPGTARLDQAKVPSTAPRGGVSAPGGVQCMVFLSLNIIIYLL
jgi:hypothetical protein